MTVHVLESINNPWAYCARCGDGVLRRADGRNLPCLCVAAVASVCPTWDESGACLCDDAAADALQAALEDQERGLIQAADVPSPEVAEWAARFGVEFPPGVASRVRVVHLRDAVPDEPDPRKAGPADDAFEQALAQASRLKAGLSWAALCGFLLLMAGLWAYGRPW